jgi:tetratricopeptide (TPR) repeat protein
VGDLLFISYASADLERAKALHDRLVGEGFTVWLDRTRLEPGMRWHEKIDEACEAARVMLPLITPRWKDSEWTRYETYVHDAVIPVLAEGDPKDTLTPPLRGLNGVTLDPLAADETRWQALFTAIRAKLATPAPERAPRIVDLPYPANPFFTGREDDLVRLHEALHEAPIAALTQGRVSAIAAMGGVGKTTLANEYVRRYWRLYPQILWVDARRGYESEYARLFDRLFPGRAQADLKPDEKAQQALAELNSKAERLLVIDNAEDAESVRPWLPREAESGCRTLITSRFADWPLAENIRAVHLFVLEPDPARLFLVTRTGRAAEGGERAACDALAKALGYLPLALEQAGAYIASGAGVTFADYLRLFEAATSDLLGRDVEGSTRYPAPVLGTWRMTVEKLSPESRAILRLCAWYADTPIPNALVLGGATEILTLAASFGPIAPLGDTPAAAELRLRDALAGLKRYSMTFDATADSFRIHGLVQAVERVEAEKDGHAADARKQAVERLAGVFPDGFVDISVWPLCRQLMPHQEALIARLGPNADSPALAGLLNLVAVFMGGLGEARVALPFYQRALDIRERVLGPDHPDTLISLSNLALGLQTFGDAAAALPLNRRALDARERVFGPDHADTIVSVNNLALCVQELGDAAAALPLHRRALNTQERVLGPDHPDTLRSVSNLASCLQALGDAAAAMPLYRRALDARERVLGPDHPHTLISVSILADGLRVLGDAASALPLNRRALDGRERVLGPEHPATLRSVNNLAHCLEALGDTAAALPLCRRALDTRERVLGPEHPETLVSMNNLAHCLRALGDAAAALLLHGRALAIQERVLGPDHPDTLVSVHNVAHDLQALGEMAAALQLNRRALDARERVLGSDHPDTFLSLNNLARCLQALGDPAAALPLLRRAVDGGERVLGKGHPWPRQFEANLAKCEQAVRG